MCLSRLTKLKTNSKNDKLVKSGIGWLERTIILQSKSKKTQGLIQADAGIALHQIWPGFCEKQIYNMYERMTGKKSTMSYNKTRKWLRDNFKE